MLHEVMVGDCVEAMRGLRAGSVQCCVTSPPYYGLRSYLPSGHPLKSREIGTEKTPEAYVARLMEVFREVRRCLRDDGTLWLNLGDSYATSPAGVTKGDPFATSGLSGGLRNSRVANSSSRAAKKDFGGLKNKDLLLIPHRVAMALQADGWWLRSAIVWAKPNPMPESVRDRPTSAYEMVFLLAKAPTYFYDPAAIMEEYAESSIRAHAKRPTKAFNQAAYSNGAGRNEGASCGLVNGAGRFARGGRNARNVWTITPKPFRGAHFAVMPPELAERCIRAGSRPGDVVLDPFGGAGTTAVVAKQLGRSSVSCELSDDFADMARQRIRSAEGQEQGRVAKLLIGFQEFLKSRASDAA